MFFIRFQVFDWDLLKYGFFSTLLFVGVLYYSVAQITYILFLFVVQRDCSCSWVYLLSWFFLIWHLKLIWLFHRWLLELNVKRRKRWLRLQIWLNLLIFLWIFTFFIALIFGHLLQNWIIFESVFWLIEKHNGRLVDFLIVLISVLQNFAFVSRLFIFIELLYYLFAISAAVFVIYVGLFQFLIWLFFIWIIYLVEEFVHTLS